ncbi:MAG TPA: DMT family transporter [Candidatus Limnocylindrales bacterium]
MTPPTPPAVDPSASDNSASENGAPVHGRTAALLLLALLSLVWGVHWVVVKEALHYFPPLTYGALRLVTGLVTMVAIVGATGRLRRPPRADLPVILSVSVIQMAVSILIMNFALQAVPAGRSSVLAYAMPLWVALLLWVLFRVTPRRNELLGIVLGVAGVAILVNPSVIDWGVPAEVAGTVALIVYGMLWAGVTIHIRRHTWHASPLELQPWMLLVATVPVVLAALVLEPGRTIDWQPAAIFALAYSGPLATAFAYWASQSITRSLGPISSAMGFLATPVVGLVAGAILLHESLGPADLAGFALVIAGIAAASLVPALSGRGTAVVTSETLPARPG